MTGAAPYDFYGHYIFGLPGNRSIFPGVRLLPPNFVLQLRSGGLRRFWPREPRQERRTAPLVEEVTQLFRQTADAVATRWRPCASVTAGVDSRVTLAAFRNVPAATFFTYDRGDQDRIDVEVARLACKKLGREHRPVKTVPRRQAPRVYAAIKATHDYRHFPAAAPLYRANFSGTDIHVRSNLAEIGRAFWRQYTGTGSFDPAKCARILESVKGRSRQGHERSLVFAAEAFAEMFRDFGYDQMDPQDPKLLGYDGWDLFYWEHRMPTWHSQVLMGSDFAFDTVILFNSRRVLTTLLAAPLIERKKSTVLRRYISATCPELRGIPFNPKELPILVKRRGILRWAGKLLRSR